MFEPHRQSALIIESRRKTIMNALNLINSAKRLFELKEYPLSCFSGMTALEEMGKLMALWGLQHGYPVFEYIKTEDNKNVDLGKLNKFLYNHRKKILRTAFFSFFINSGATRRHGRHPKNGVPVVDGIIQLASTEDWMKLRNSCLYTDFSMKKRTADSPIDIIKREHAYYFITMGLEALAQYSNVGLDVGRSDSSKESFDFFTTRLNELRRFMTIYSNTVDIFSLDFLSKMEPG